MTREKHYRSIIKAFSWRMTGTLDTILISWLISGKWRVAISIGVVELFTKITLYYFHERLWDRISLGRVETNKGMDYNI